MREIIKLRESYRKKKDYKKSDLVRSSLKAIGVAVEDQEGKTSWKAE